MFEPAPLVETPEDPIPKGAEAEWFVGAGGAKLRAALFTPPGRPRGSVVLSGGRTEPIEKYFEFIGDLMDRGFVVLAHDWRGQGLSAREIPDRLKGHAKGYKAFLEDFRRLLNTYEERLPKPWVAIGHSMGGCLTLLAMAHGEKRFSSALLSAPMLGLKLGKFSPTAAATLMRLNLALGRAGRYLMGEAGKPFDDTFEGNVLTHDPRRFARHRAQIRANPDLALGGPTWGWLDFALKATAFLAKPERLRSIMVPVEIVSAGEDALVDNAAQAAAVRNLPQGRLITVPGAYHEILMETDDMRNFFLRVLDTLTGKTAPKPAQAPKAAPAAAAEAPKPAATAKPAEAPKPAASPAPSATASAPAPASKPAPAPKPAASPAAKSAAASSKASKAPAAKSASVKAEPAPKAEKPAKTAAPKPAAPAKAAVPKPAPKATTAIAKASAKPTVAKAPAQAAAKPSPKATAPKPAVPKPAAPKAAAPKTPTPKPVSDVAKTEAKPAAAVKAAAAKTSTAKSAGKAAATTKPATAKKPAAAKSTAKT